MIRGIELLKLKLFDLLSSLLWLFGLMGIPDLFCFTDVLFGIKCPGCYLIDFSLSPITYFVKNILFIIPLIFAFIITGFQITYFARKEDKDATNIYGVKTYMFCIILLVSNFIIVNL